MNKYLEKIASTEDLVNAGLGAGLGYGSEVLATKHPNSKFLKALTFGHKGMGAAAGAVSNVIAGRLVSGMFNKQASDYEYSGPSNWQTAGMVGAGLGGSSAMLGSALNDVITPEIQNHLVGGDTRPLMLRLRELTESAKNGMDGVKSNPLAYKVARKGAGAVALGGLALSLPVGVAAHRQYQDYKSGNPESHYLRSALLGGVAGGLAPTKHLTVGRGALAGLGASAANQIYQHYKGTPNE